MLPRPKSIFNIGEEEGGEEELAFSNIALTSTSGIIVAHGGGGLVGLRVAIQHHGARGSNIVTKSTLKSSTPCRSGYVRPRCPPPKGLPEFGFLKTCLFCMRELRLEKEVYMYRGDQGFCSVECRYKQILIDERRESDTSKSESCRAPHSICSSNDGPTSDHHGRRKISAAA